MNQEFVRVALLIGLSAALLSIRGFWRVTSEKSARARWGYRLLSLPVSAAMGGIVFTLLFVPKNQGTWFCLICASQREELRWAGVAMMTGEAATPSPDDEVLSAYEHWYRDRIGAEHEHSWWPIGCHFTGIATITCSLIQNLPHIQYLPNLPDGQLAVRVVGRFLETPARDHASLQRGMMQAARDHRDQAGSPLDSPESLVPVFESWLAGGIIQANR